MIKMLSAIAALFFCCTTVSAQTPFVPTTEGMKLEYVQKDKNGKVAGYFTSTVVAVTSQGADTLVEILSEETDADRKSIDQSNQLPALYRVSGDKVYTLKETLAPLEEFIPAEMAQDIEFVVKGSDLEFPFHPAVGQKLPDSVIEIWINEIGKEDNARKFLTLTYSDRKIVAQEDIVTEAGTFNCYKISETMRIKAMLILNMSAINETWYSPGIGVVLQKSYYKKKLIETGELVSVSGRIPEKI